MFPLCYTPPMERTSPHSPVTSKENKAVKFLASLADPKVRHKEKAFLIEGVKMVEEALRESEDRYRSLVEQQGEGLGVVDGNEVFTFANPAAHEIFGVPPGMLVGRSLLEFIPSGGVEAVR